MSALLPLPPRIVDLTAHEGSPSERVVLRRLCERDLTTLVRYRSAEEVARYQSWSPSWGMDDARAFLASDQRTTHAAPGQWVQYVIEDQETLDVCGDLGVHFVEDPPHTVELGVTVSPPYQRRGIATEGLEMMLRWLFLSLEVHRVFAQADERNLAVRAVFSKLGFRHEATFVDADWFKGEWSTLCVYAALLPDLKLSGPFPPGSQKGGSGNATL